ncbi:MAG: hypothetical protein KBH06_03725 [Spirochaetes bacterium]|nr:hypothetical protein [Spirochaetota bacterium]
MKLFKRDYSLDNLRAVLILLVIFHHSAEAYTSGSEAWPVRDAASLLNGIEIFSTVNAAFLWDCFFLFPVM